MMEATLRLPGGMYLIGEDPNFKIQKRKITAP
jgi:hypothetical protein